MEICLLKYSEYGNSPLLQMEHPKIYLLRDTRMNLNLYGFCLSIVFVLDLHHCKFWTVVKDCTATREYF